jgi:hypothetical protein
MCPERRDVLAGESPVRVSAEASGSRPQLGGEVRAAERSVKSPWKRGEQPSGPQHKVNAKAWSYSQPKSVWERRAAHVTAKATDSTPDSKRALDLLGVEGDGTLGQNQAEASTRTSDRLGLTLHAAKTRLVDLRRGKGSFVFLGCTIRKTRSIPSLVFHRAVAKPKGDEETPRPRARVQAAKQGREADHLRK